jgi:hypothetical protein
MILLVRASTTNWGSYILLDSTSLYESGRWRCQKSLLPSAASHDMSHWRWTTRLPVSYNKVESGTKGGASRDGAHPQRCRIASVPEAATCVTLVGGAMGCGPTVSGYGMGHIPSCVNFLVFLIGKITETTSKLLRFWEYLGGGNRPKNERPKLIF